MVPCFGSCGMLATINRVVAPNMADFSGVVIAFSHVLGSAGK